MNSAYDRAALWPVLLTQQVGEQRTSEFRPIDIVRGGLFAGKRDETRRTVPNYYIGSMPRDDDILASGKMLNCKAGLGVP